MTMLPSGNGSREPAIESGIASEWRSSVMRGAVCSCPSRASPSALEVSSRSLITTSRAASMASSRAVLAALTNPATRSALSSAFSSCRRSRSWRLCALSYSLACSASSSTSSTSSTASSNALTTRSSSTTHASMCDSSIIAISPVHSRLHLCRQ